MKRFIKCLCAAAVLSAVLLTACANEDVENSTINPHTTGETVSTSTDETTVKTDSEDIPELNNTYTTQFGAVNAITYPQFAFDYSDNWTVTTEEVSKGSQSGINEEFVLTNANGVTVHYIDFGNLGGSGKSIVQYEVTKAADSQFTAGYVETDTGVKNLADEWGNFMVGEVKAVGEYDMATGELMPADGKVSYAVMPNSYIGTHEAAGLTGYYEEFVTEYGNYLLFAEASDNGFSEQDKQEVIRILSSFRRISENL